MKKRICGIVCFLGLMLMFGSVGAMELNTLSFGQGIFQSATGLAIAAGAGYIGGFME